MWWMLKLSFVSANKTVDSPQSPPQSMADPPIFLTDIVHGCRPTALSPSLNLPCPALGRAASRARREERGVLEDEYASDLPAAPRAAQAGEQRRAAPWIGPATWLTMGCGGMPPQPRVREV